MRKRREWDREEKRMVKTGNKGGWKIRGQLDNNHHHTLIFSWVLFLKFRDHGVWGGQMVAVIYYDFTAK